MICDGELMARKTFHGLGRLVRAKKVKAEFLELPRQCNFISILVPLYFIPLLFIIYVCVCEMSAWIDVKLL